MEEIEATVAIVGAGPAGLATAACLRTEGIELEILERDQVVGAAWHRHYERLHLHTNRRNSALPYLGFPRSAGRYPSRQEVADYLARYARSFDLAPRFGEAVVRVERSGDRWEVESARTLVRAPHVVIATGTTRTPKRASWPGLASFPGEVLHSADYRTGERFAGRQVLVVGCGNSAAEIAIDLHERGARPGLAVRGPVNVTSRDVLGLSSVSLSVALSPLPSRVADALASPLLAASRRRARAAGLSLQAYGPFTQIERDRRIPLLDVGTLRLLREGHIRLHGAIERFDGPRVVFARGEPADYDAVVLGTGYSPGVADFVLAPEALDESGTPLRSGAESPAPGLYFCGYHVASTGMLREINRESRRIARAILRSHKA